MGYKNTSPSPFADERRIAPRYHLRFEILVMSQNRSLRSRTVNLSVSGALMEDATPMDFLGPVDVVIIIPHVKGEQKTYLNFRGLVVGKSEASHRLTFLQDKDESFDKLKRMIMEVEKFRSVSSV